LIEGLAARLANTIKSANPENTASFAVLRYGIIILFNFLTTVFLSLAVGILLGKVEEFLLGLLVFMALRAVSGGYHFKSSMMCTLATTATVVIAAYISLPETVSIVVNALSCVLVLLFAPSRIERQSNIPTKFYPYLKMLSLLMVAANFAIQSDLLTVIFCLQCISLIHFTKERRE
jgi:accessory gene regulator B